MFEAQDLWYDNYGHTTDDELCKLSKTEKRILFDFLHSLPLNIDVEVNGIKYKLVHGSPLENYKLYGEKYHSETEFAVWHRWKPGDMIPEGYTLIFGHTPTYRFQDENPPCIWKGENAIEIDCGAGLPPYFYYSGRFACIRLDDMKIFYSE